MTAFDRFDPFEQRITDALDEIAAAHRPDYLDDVFRQTARSSQRPRWTFPERWLPMDTTLPRRGPLGIPFRPLIVLLIVALLAVALGVVVVGSRQRVPPPFGPAGNGALAYAENGDIYVRDSLAGVSRALIVGADREDSPGYSPDGRLVAFISSKGQIDHPTEYLKVANVDGGDVRLLLPDQLVDWSANWSPDSRSLVVVTTLRKIGDLLVVPVDGSPATTINIGDLKARDAIFAPDGTLLFRAIKPDGTVDMFSIHSDGTGLRALGLPSPLAFGADWDNSGPAWAPDGKRIAYNRVEPVPGADPAGHFRLHLVNPDGSGDLAVPGPADPAVQEAWPQYSPDGRSIVVHRWTWKSNNGGEGWLAVLPADGSAPAHDVGPRIPGGEDTGLLKTWSPDGTRILMGSSNTKQVFSIDPVTGQFDQLPWTNVLPDWQRVAR
jgi:Tol biopolymer transport system component